MRPFFAHWAKKKANHNYFINKRSPEHFSHSKIHHLYPPSSDLNEGIMSYEQICDTPLSLAPINMALHIVINTWPQSINSEICEILSLGF